MELTPNVMFKSYKISEWEEKREILSSDELNLIEAHLNGKQSFLASLLLDQLRLPFPKFAHSYFSAFSNSVTDEYLKDPAFGYKLYLISTANLNSLRMVMCQDYKDLPANERKKHLDNFSQFKEFMMMPLDKIPSIMTARGYNKDLRRKYIYLTKYIDLEEAERLNITCTQTFKNLGANGYELSEKLNLFNPITRHILESYYGFSYGKRTELKYIAEVLHISVRALKQLFDTIEPMFLKEYGVIKNNLNPLGKKDEIILYGNKAFRDYDLGLTTKVYYQQVLSEKEKEVLKAPTAIINTETNIYILKKYIFPSMTTVELSDYLVIDRTKIADGETLPPKK